jgi:hypothetical protein
LSNTQVIDVYVSGAFGRSPAAASFGFVVPVGTNCQGRHRVRLRRRDARSEPGGGSQDAFVLLPISRDVAAPRPRPELQRRIELPQRVVWPMKAEERHRAGDTASQPDWMAAVGQARVMDCRQGCLELFAAHVLV